MNFRKMFYIGLTILVLVVIIFGVRSFPPAGDKQPMSELARLIIEGQQLGELHVEQTRVWHYGVPKKGQVFLSDRAQYSRDPSMAFTDELSVNGVSLDTIPSLEVRYENTSTMDKLVSSVLQFIMMLILPAILFIAGRRLLSRRQGQHGEAKNFHFFTRGGEAVVRPSRLIPPATLLETVAEIRALLEEGDNSQVVAAKDAAGAQLTFVQRADRQTATIIDREVNPAAPESFTMRKRAILYIITGGILLLAIAVNNYFDIFVFKPAEYLPFSEFASVVNLSDPQLLNLVLDEDTLHATIEGKLYVTYKDHAESLRRQLQQFGVSPSIVNQLNIRFDNRFDRTVLIASLLLAVAINALVWRYRRISSKQPKFFWGFNTDVELIVAAHLIEPANMLQDELAKIKQVINTKEPKFASFINPGGVLLVYQLEGRRFMQVFYKNTGAKSA